MIYIRETFCLRHRKGRNWGFLRYIIDLVSSINYLRSYLLKCLRLTTVSKYTRVLSLSIFLQDLNQGSWRRQQRPNFRSPFMTSTGVSLNVLVRTFTLCIIFVSKNHRFLNSFDCYGGETRCGRYSETWMRGGVERWIHPLKRGWGIGWKTEVKRGVVNSDT